MKLIYIPLCVVFLYSCSGTNVSQSNAPKNVVIDFTDRPIKDCKTPALIGGLTLSMVHTGEGDCEPWFETFGNDTVLGLWPGKIRVDINNQGAIKSIRVDAEDHCGTITIISYDADDNQIENIAGRDDSNSRHSLTSDFDKLSYFTVEGDCEGSVTEIVVSYE